MSCERFKKPTIMLIQQIQCLRNGRTIQQQSITIANDTQWPIHVNHSCAAVWHSDIWWLLLCMLLFFSLNCLFVWHCHTKWLFSSFVPSVWHIWGYLHAHKTIEFRFLYLQKIAIYLNILKVFWHIYMSCTLNLSESWKTFAC